MFEWLLKVFQKDSRLKNLEINKKNSLQKNSKISLFDFSASWWFDAKFGIVEFAFFPLFNSLPPIQPNSCSLRDATLCIYPWSDRWHLLSSMVGISVHATTYGETWSSWYRLSHSSFQLISSVFEQIILSSQPPSRLAITRFDCGWTYIIVYRMIRILRSKIIFFIPPSKSRIIKDCLFDGL